MRRFWQRLTGRWALLALVIAALAMTGCEDAGEEKSLSPSPSPESLVLLPTEELRATPTLASGLPTAPPPPPTLAPGVTPDTPTPTQTSTPTATPTATPLPSVRIEMGRAELAQGNLAAAAAQFEASLASDDELSQTIREEGLYTLGVTYMEDEQYAAAVATFNQLLGVSAGQARSETYFYLGRAYGELGEYTAAVGAYQAYLDQNPEMSPFISPFIAGAYIALGERDKAVAAYEAALSGLAFPPMLFDVRLQLADFYMEDGQYEAAAAQYRLLAGLAERETTHGRMLYLAGNAEIMAGDVEAGHALYLEAFHDAPRAYESYLGLVELVAAGVPVDEYQRGLVDFYAGMYEPAITAFSRAILDDSETVQPDAHLYLAWSYEAMDNREMALAHLDQFATVEPARALIERAKLLARSGEREAAANAYQEYLSQYPDGDQAPFAAWWAAALTERSGDVDGAIVLYRELAETYSWHEDAPEALFRAGWLAYGQGEQGAAQADWQRAAQAYPTSHFGAASLFWLLKTHQPVTDTVDAGGEMAYPGDEAAESETATPTATPDLSQVIASLVANSRSDNYYTLRARDIISGVAPFAPSGGLELPANEEAAQAEAEAWLRNRLGLEQDANVSRLAPVLAGDPRLIVGTKLWNLGLWSQAKAELEAVRKDHSDDALANYQLALYFRDLGLYRSSILAASTLLSLTGETAFTAPRFIGRLAYPLYYADLILPLAEKYGYDPLLQFALVRQESLFESFARSGAAAQGLAQVIPDTGAYIAQRLNWPDYENEDLFKPYVGLAFGAYYLDEQLRAFDEHVHAALSAYNAGPGNAARWYVIAGEDHDAYVETVDFAETRLYIERIYAGYVIYRTLYAP